MFERMEIFEQVYKIGKYSKKRTVYMPTISVMLGNLREEKLPIQPTPRSTDLISTTENTKEIQPMCRPERINAC